MQFTHKHLKEIEPTLVKILNAKIPCQAGFRLVRFSNALIKVMREIEETRSAMIKLHGEQNEDGTFEIKNPKKVKEFGVAWKQHMDETVELEVRKVKLSELAEAGMTLVDFAALEFMIENDVDEPPKVKKKKH